ncbi:glycosyltransferase family 39 protein, partial [Candidatus Dojkabacteria bacterium]|nr:glycosyltransferase family 39 protein [Candidatus Dojkabacteria bacterium]
YSFLSVYIFYLLSKEILKKEWMRVLAVFFLTNTLMFQFLSSSINYDNLGNLFCILSVYFFTKFVKSKINVKYLLYMLLFIGLGGITKYTTLPLSFILIILSGVEMYFRREEFKSIRKGKGLLLLIPVLILLCLNIGIYGVNLVKYGSLEPNCNQILTHEQCLENGVYYRDNIERPSINIGGISDIFTLIKTGKRIDPVRYLWYWSVNLVSKIYGIMGDSSLYMPKIFPYLFIGLFAVVVVVGILNRRKWDKADIYLLLISLFYASILFFVQNYSMYLRKNHMYLALQGRYLFPVLPMIYILVSKSLSFIKNNRLRYILIGMFVLLFLYSNIPFFFLNVESWWFGVNF